uniref:Uncharacterized protein n=1 Tax=Anguilla anguilla TaxID=7936 RepID=A0A0E9SZP6_ANGAN
MAMPVTSKTDRHTHMYTHVHTRTHTRTRTHTHTHHSHRAIWGQRLHYAASCRPF